MSTAPAMIHPAEEGTIVFDGLVEGPLPETTEGEAALWAIAARGLGGIIKVSLAVEGGRFSLLPTNRAIATKVLGVSSAVGIAQTIKRDLDKLVNLCPPARRGLMSTLRSVETRHGEQEQTLFAYRDGACEVHTRVVAAATTPMRRRGRKQWWLAVTALFVLILLFAGSYIWDYGTLLRKYTTRIDTTALSVDASAVEGRLKVRFDGITEENNGVHLWLEPGESPPREVTITVTDTRGKPLFHAPVPLKRQMDSRSVQLLMLNIDAPLMQTTYLGVIRVHSPKYGASPVASTTTSRPSATQP